MGKRSTRRIKRSRSSAFWQGPGALLALLLMFAVAAGLIAAAAAGPPVVSGLALAVLGALVLYYRQGFGDFSYQQARLSTFWELDSERLKPNAEQERSISTAYAGVIGAAFAIGGIAWAIADLFRL